MSPFFDSGLESRDLPLLFRERRMKKRRAKKRHAPSPKPMTRPAMSPVCELDLELLAALVAAELLVTTAAVETTVTCCLWG